MKQHKDILARSIETYNKAADQYGVSSKAVLWNDQQTQYLRFYELVRHLDLNDANKSLLDIGCGNGELYKFLNFLGFRGSYTGFDINDKLLAQARDRFHEIDVKNVDIMTEEPRQPYHYVVMSGLLNANVGQSADWVFRFVKRMFSLCGDVAVFNMISTHVTRKDETMFYMDPAGMLTFCIENLSKRVSLAHHNLPFNYTVAVFRNETWKSVKDAIE